MLASYAGEKGGVNDTGIRYMRRVVRVKLHGVEDPRLIKAIPRGSERTCRELQSRKGVNRVIMYHWTR